MLLHEEIIASAASGIASTALGHPLDCVKVRLQTGGVHSSAWACAADMLRREGVGSFGRGLGMPLANAVLMNSVMFVAFAEARRRLPDDATGALLAGDGAEIMRDARRSVDAIKRELPGVSADKLVEMEPRMLFEDIGEGLAALRELWPEDAFRTSEAENPFFAEELALAIKALNGKGSETPRR